ncbi:MAG: hypothetical protein B7Z77_05780 [Acidocella sp. 20-58-15]|nr:MAG: hypothetical protein B7Z77_05780 [Acidocella sp. 20-58-15]
MIKYCKAQILPSALLQYGGSLFLLVMLLMFIALRDFLPSLYNMLCEILYGVRGQEPFIDLGDILRAGVCWRHGVNVYVPSVCLDGGVFNYSPILLNAARLPLEVSDRGVGGLLMAFGFIASVALLPKAASVSELVFRCAAVASTATWYAIEQGNLDLCLFAIIMLGVWLLRKNHKLSVISYVLFGVAAAAKFYPAILFLLGLRERVFRLSLLVLAGCILVVVVFVACGSGIVKAASEIPLSQPFRATFGARDLFGGLALLHVLPWHSATHVIRPFYPSTALMSEHRLSNLLTVLMSLGALALAWMDAPRYSMKLPQVDPSRLVFLVAGALLIVFCFFAAQNVYYRGIFLVMLLPGFWNLAYPRSGGTDWRARLLIVLTLALLWEAAIREVVHGVIGGAFPLWVEEATMVVVWLARELAWWWLVIQLTALVIAFFRRELIRLHRDMRLLLP